MKSGMGALAAVCLAAACGTGRSESETTTEEDPRRVLVVSLDTTRADQLGAYGGPASTPHLDALAARSAVFTAAQAPAPTTLASHVSMLSGNYPQTHGVPLNGSVIHPDNVMLAERLRAAGFHSAAFLGSFALDARNGFDQGFDHFDAEFDLLLGDSGDDQDQRRADRVTDAVLDYVDGRPGESVFLFVHYFDPHHPYDPPAPYDRGRGEAGRPLGTLAELSLATHEHHRRAGIEPVSQNDLYLQGLTRELLEDHANEATDLDRELAELYRAEIEYMDEHLGRLFDGLAQRGWDEDALVLVTADHGETFHEHADTWNHGLWVHETTVHVPLIVSAPGALGRGLRVTDPVSTVDLVPTVLDLLGIEADGRIEGRSLAPYLRGERLPPRPVFTEATQPKQQAGGTWRNSPKAKAIRVGSWKYVWAPYLEYEALFELSSDPDELVNRIDDPDAALQLAPLRETLRAWSASARPLPSNMDLDPETVQKLRDMGYF